MVRSIVLFIFLGISTSGWSQRNIPGFWSNLDYGDRLYSGQMHSMHSINPVSKGYLIDRVDTYTRSGEAKTQSLFCTDSCFWTPGTRLLIKRSYSLPDDQGKSITGKYLLDQSGRILEYTEYLGDTIIPFWSKELRKYDDQGHTIYARSWSSPMIQSSNNWWYEYSYTEDGQVNTAKTFREPTMGSPYLVDSIITTFNQDRKKTEVNSYNRFDNTVPFRHSGRRLYLYNNEGQLNKVEYYWSQSASDSMHLSGEAFYQYNPNGRLARGAFISYPSNYLQINDYSIDGNVLRYQEGRVIEADTVIHLMINYSYSDDNLDCIKRYHYFNGNNWKEIHYTRNRFNESGQLLFSEDFFIEDDGSYSLAEGATGRNIFMYDKNGCLVVHNRFKKWAQTDSVPDFSRFIRWKTISTTSGPLQPARKLRIWPNPCQDQLWISTEESVSGLCEIVVQNVSGKVVKRMESYSGLPAFVGVIDIPPGVYSLSIRYNGFQEHRLFIKQ